MKKCIYILFVLLFLVSCSKNNAGYDALERGLIGILEKKDYEYIMKNINESAKAGNEDVYGLAYTYLAENGSMFFNKVKDLLNTIRLFCYSKLMEMNFKF